MKKWSFSALIFNEIPKSFLIKLLAKLLLENKEEAKLFSSKKEEIGFEKYFQRTIRSMKISDPFGFRAHEISDVFNFGQNLIRNFL